MKTHNGYITQLDENEVIVFGSNLAGRHGAGLAKTALDKFGAIYGRGQGLQGRAYALPTMDFQIKPLDLWTINRYVAAFLQYADKHTGLTFYVSEVGCGLGGKTIEDIAPLFYPALLLDNVVLPKSFQSILHQDGISSKNFWG